MKNEAKIIIICNGTSCRKDGANQVLKEFKKQTKEETGVRTKHCFGKCGNGLIVVVLPEITWYDHVKLSQVPLIIKEHCL